MNRTAEGELLKIAQSTSWNICAPVIGFPGGPIACSSLNRAIKSCENPDAVNHLLANDSRERLFTYRLTYRRRDLLRVRARLHRGPRKCFRLRDGRKTRPVAKVGFVAGDS
jgi:hypothetical protein